MRQEKSENFYSNSLFAFVSRQCDMVFSELPTIPGKEPDVVLGVGDIGGSSVRFAFSPKKGLVRIADDGTVVERNVLGTFLSLKSERGYKRFFKENGFLLPLVADRYTYLDGGDFESISRRMKATLDILDLAGKEALSAKLSNEDYLRLSRAVFYLLFSPRICMKDGERVIYSSVLHPLMGILTSNLDWLTRPSSEEIHNGTIVVSESDGTKTPVDSDFWTEVDAGYDDSCDALHFADVVRLFVGGRNLAKEERNGIEALYHFFTEVGAIVSYNPLEVKNAGAIPIERLSDIGKNKLMRLAKDVAKSEIDENIKNVHPFYDVERMEPRWNVDSLLSAMYFSIFYLNSGVELMRPCANPKCGKYFKVGRSDSKKKYCSAECRNRAGQARHRGRASKA